MTVVRGVLAISPVVVVDTTGAWVQDSNEVVLESSNQLLSQVSSMSSGGTSLYVIFDTNPSDNVVNFSYGRSIGCPGFGALVLFPAYPFV